MVTTPEESNFLVPDGSFFVELVLFSIGFFLLVMVPLVGAATRRQWVWLVMILLLGPFAGVPWFFLGSSRGQRHGTRFAGTEGA